MINTYMYMGESRLPLSRLPVYFCFSSPSISAYLPRLQSFISPTIASHFPDYRFLLHFPDYSVSLYTHSKDKRDFKSSCLIFLDHNFTTIILCDKLFLQLKKKYFFQIFLFFLQVFIFLLDNKSSISRSNNEINILKKS